jgi:hypothetical protein
VESRTEPCPKGRKGKASGLVKLLCDAKGQILGPHGLGPRGGDLLQPLVVAMREKIPMARLSQIIHAIRPWSKLTAAPPTSLTAKAVRQRAGAVAADPGVLGDRERGPAMINKKKLLLVVVLLALIGLAIAFRGHLRVESLLAQMRALGPWGPLAFILLYGIAPSLFVPGLPLTLAGGCCSGRYGARCTASSGRPAERRWRCTLIAAGPCAPWAPLAFGKCLRYPLSSRGVRGRGWRVTPRSDHGENGICSGLFC